MLNQTPEQRRLMSIEIERLMKEDLRSTIAAFVKSYGKTLHQKLGLEKDDLENEIREQVWKGLLTHNPRAGANIKTYLNNLIKNRFLTLYRRSTIKKNNMVNYYADVFATPGIDEDHLMTEENGETVFMQRQVIMHAQAALGEADRTIYEDLLLGKNLEEMMKAHGLTRVKLIESITRIDAMIREARKVA